MAVTKASFRAAFPEFANTTTYPDTELDFWLGLGVLLLSVERWGNLIDYGLQLFVAHNLVLSAQAVRASASGNIPGQVEGPITSATVDKVSYSRDAASVMDPKNGHWGLTTYGLRYIRLVNMVGAGPVQVGVPYGAYEPGAWPGPPYTPFG